MFWNWSVAGRGMCFLKERWSYYAHVLLGLHFVNGYNFAHIISMAAVLILPSLRFDLNSSHLPSLPPPPLGFSVTHWEEVLTCLKFLKYGNSHWHGNKFPCSSDHVVKKLWLSCTHDWKLSFKLVYTMKCSSWYYKYYLCEKSKVNVSVLKLGLWSWKLLKSLLKQAPTEHKNDSFCLFRKPDKMFGKDNFL